MVKSSCPTGLCPPLDEQKFEATLTRYRTTGARNAYRAACREVRWRCRPPEGFDVQLPKDAAGVRLLGDARPTDSQNALQLARPDEAGGLWARTPQLVAGGFTTSFTCAL